MRRPDGAPRQLNLSPDQRDALVAYLESLTDSTFLSAPKFSNPFTVAKQAGTQ
jgi:cytochrome c peroxidase